MGHADRRERVVVRAIQAEEWRRVRDLRLEALKDPVADLAFFETYAQSAARSESYWRERAAGAAEGARERQQFIAETGGGEWVGSVTVLVEHAGARDVFGHVVARAQAHIVGVFVRPEYRGGAVGVTGELFDAALKWAWATGAERVRLFVHERNTRARAFYRKAGFVAIGVSLPGPAGVGGRELEYVLGRRDRCHTGSSY